MKVKQSRSLSKRSHFMQTGQSTTTPPLPPPRPPCWTSTLSFTPPLPLPFLLPRVTPRAGSAPLSRWLTRHWPLAHSAEYTLCWLVQRWYPVSWTHSWDCTARLNNWRIWSAIPSLSSSHLHAGVSHWIKDYYLCQKWLAEPAQLCKYVDLVATLVEGCAAIFASETKRWWSSSQWWE